MPSIDDIISKIYFDPSGYGSKATTLKDARKINKEITKEDVDNWFEINVEKKTKPQGQNSFVAPHAFYEFQLDLFFINDLENQKFKAGLIMIDIFSKFMHVVPISSKSEGDVAAGLIECLNNFPKKPLIIYSDDEPALRTEAIQKYLEKEKIKHILTRSHAWFVERAVRTFKDMLYKRFQPGKQWTEYIYPILLTYNHKLVHSATGFTPGEATKEDNKIEVKLNMEMHGKSNRNYPEVHVGDHVKIFVKKRAITVKQQQSYWSENKYKVIEITKTFNQKHYKLEGLTRQYLRHELLKVL